MNPTLRPVKPDDAPAIGQIIYTAFATIGREHNFPPDFASPEPAIGLMKAFIAHPGFFGVAAEVDGRIVGSNFLDQRGPIQGVGPITIDPGYQSNGLGRRLMQAVIERGHDAQGIRLVQDAFNGTSMALYASLGFDVKEPLVLMSGRTRSAPPAHVTVRPLQEADLPACADLHMQVHGVDRSAELRGCMAHFSPMVMERDGEVRAYASAPYVWFANHGVAEGEDDLLNLLAGASAASDQPLSLLIPTRQSSLFRWCLAEGLRIVKPMTLMAMGVYYEPCGPFYPSVSY